MRVRTNRSMDEAELISAGQYGLLCAARSFQPSEGIPFAAWARYRVRGAMLDAMRGEDTVSRTERRFRRRVEQQAHELRCTLGREPEESELAERLGVTVDYLRERQQAVATKLVALEVACREAEDVADPAAATESDTIRSQADRCRMDRVRAAALFLRPRWQEVVTMHYEAGLNFREIGRRLGITHGRVSQIHDAAIERLQDELWRAA